MDTVIKEISSNSFCPCLIQLISSWIERCKEMEIPVSDDFSLINVSADPFEIRQWNADGLPRDQVCEEYQT